MQKITENLNVHQGMPDQPSDAGYTGATLKQKYDEPADTIKKKFNALIDTLASKVSGNSGADKIGASVTGVEGNTVKAVLQSLQEKKADANATTAALTLKADKVNTYTKGEVDLIASGKADATGTAIALNQKADKSDTYTKLQVDTMAGSKVDKVSGKELSTNDYTTEEKSKLAGIADGANNYVLPIATDTQVGGVKAGPGTEIQPDGTITAQAAPAPDLVARQNLANHVADNIAHMNTTLALSGAIVNNPNILVGSLYPRINVLGNATEIGTGVKSPDNPYQLVSSKPAKITVGNKNILFNISPTQTINGVTFTVNADTSVTCNGTATANAIFLVNRQARLDRNSILGQTLTLSGCPSGGSDDSYRLQFWNYKSGSLTKYDFGNGLSFVFENKTEDFNVAIFIKAGFTCNNVKFEPMLEVEAVKTTYTPYSAVEYPAPAGLELNSVGDVRDEWDATTGMKIQRVGKAVFNGGAGELWGDPFTVGSLTGFYIPISAMKSGAKLNGSCSHLITLLDQQTAYGGSCAFGANNNRFYCYLESTRFPPTTEGLAAFKALLQSSPMTVLYPLATPIVTQVSAPINIKQDINVFADAGLVSTLSTQNTPSGQVVGQVVDYIMGAGLSNDNLLPNGDFRSWQRYVGVSSKILGAGVHYTADRYYCYKGGYSTGLKVDQLVQNGLTELVMFCTENNDKSNHIACTLETLHAQALAGKTLTFSLDVRTGSAISSMPSIDIVYSTSGHVSPGSSATALVFKPLKSGRNSFTFTLPLNTKGLALGVMGMIPFNSSEAYIATSNWKLEIDSVATPSIPNLYAGETICRRYYRRGLNKLTTTVACTTAGQVIMRNAYAPQMRIAPTIRQISGTALANMFYCDDNNTQITPNSISLVSETNESFAVIAYGSFEVGKNYALVADIIELDAEIY